MQCPKCSSKEAKKVRYQDIDCIICNKCGYDETKDYEIFPEQKTNQKEKGRYTPYKAGRKT